METSNARGMMLPSKEKWMLKRREECKENYTHALMLIFDTQDAAIQVFVFQKEILRFAKFTIFYTLSSYGLFLSIRILFFLQWCHRSGINLSLTSFLLVDSVLNYLDPEIIVFQVSLKCFLTCEFVLHLIHYGTKYIACLCNPQ